MSELDVSKLRERGSAGPSLVGAVNRGFSLLLFFCSDAPTLNDCICIHGFFCGRSWQVQETLDVQRQQENEFLVSIATTIQQPPSEMDAVTLMSPKTTPARPRAPRFRLINTDTDLNQAPGH